MNKIMRIVYSAVFLGACLTPLVATVINKSEAKIPAIVEDEKINENFSAEFDSWYNDTIPFHDSFVLAANTIKSNVFNETAGNVVTGKNGWAFYNSTTDDYINSNAFSQRKINIVAQTMSLIEENITANGGEFLFAPVPNKNEIYSEYMPDRYVKSDENNLSRLYDALDEYKVSYVNLTDVLNENKDLGLYHKCDSHWNNLGAVYAFNAMLDEMDIYHKSYDGTSYEIKNDWQGDLDRILYPDQTIYDEQYHFDIDYEDFMFVQPSGISDTQAALDEFMGASEKRDTTIRSINPSEDVTENLYMVRDSFGRALLPFMIDNFSNALFERTTQPHITTLSADTNMIYEIVERNLENTISTAPLIAAPQRNIAAEFEGESPNNEIYFNDDSFYLQAYGVVDKNYLKDNSKIYLSLDNGTQTLTFEAFPIFETDLMSECSDSEDMDNGFSLRVDLKQLSAGDYKVSIIIDNTSTGVLDTVHIG